MRAAAPAPPAFRLSRRLLGLLLLLGPAGGLPPVAAEDLEPVPPALPFPDPAWRDMDPETDQQVRSLIRDHFAELGGVQLARRRLVLRFGLLAAPALAAQDGGNVTQTWNAALTLGALRDVWGPAPELSVALDPLTRLLTTDSNEIHLRAFAALALGCWHFPQGRAAAARGPDAAPTAVPGPREQAERTRAAMEASTRALANRLADDNEVVRTACLLALAKRGGPEALEAVRANVGAGVGVGQRQARLLALALLETPDPGPILDAIVQDDRRVRAAAALAVALSLLVESPPPWTEGTEENRRRLLAALTGPHILPDKADLAEATFARGVCAHRWRDPAEWRALWDRALLASSQERVAEAAAQTLLFCPEPWLLEEARRALKRGLAVKRPVLAMLLLRVAAEGSQEGVDVCMPWLKSKARRPTPDDRWDPRWYAIAGFLRALRDGRLKAQAARVEVVEALERCAATVLSRKAAPRAALERLLADHGERLKGARPEVLPAAEVAGFEAACACPSGLFGADLEALGLWRAARMVDECFYLDSVVETSTADLTRHQPQRYLLRYLEEFPYLGRLELRDERGRRPPETLDAGGGEVYDR